MDEPHDHLLQVDGNVQELQGSEKFVMLTVGKHPVPRVLGVSIHDCSPTEKVECQDAHLEALHLEGAEDPSFPEHLWALEGFADGEFVPLVDSFVVVGAGYK